MEDYDGPQYPSIHNTLPQSSQIPQNTNMHVPFLHSIPAQYNADSYRRVDKSTDQTKSTLQPVGLPLARGEIPEGDCGIQTATHTCGQSQTLQSHHYMLH